MPEKFDYNEFMKEGGRLAFAAGFGAHNNPYRDCSLEYSLWRCGWCDARDNAAIKSSEEAYE